jgi:hypothetical protein
MSRIFFKLYCVGLSELEGIPINKNLSGRIPISTNECHHCYSQSWNCVNCAHPHSLLLQSNRLLTNKLDWRFGIPKIIRVVKQLLKDENHPQSSDKGLWRRSTWETGVGRGVLELILRVTVSLRVWYALSTTMFNKHLEVPSFPDNWSCPRRERWKMLIAQVCVEYTKTLVLSFLQTRIAGFFSESRVMLFFFREKESTLILPFQNRAFWSSDYQIMIGSGESWVSC